MDVKTDTCTDLDHCGYASSCPTDASHLGWISAETAPLCPAVRWMTCNGVLGTTRLSCRQTAVGWIATGHFINRTGLTRLNADGIPQIVQDLFGALIFVIHTTNDKYSRHATHQQQKLAANALSEPTQSVDSVYEC